MRRTYRGVDSVNHPHDPQKPRDDNPETQRIPWNALSEGGQGGLIQGGQGGGKYVLHEHFPETQKFQPLGDDSQTQAYSQEPHPYAGTGRLDTNYLSPREEVPEESRYSVSEDGVEGRAIARYRSWAGLQNENPRDTLTLESYLVSNSAEHPYRRILGDWVQGRVIIDQEESSSAKPLLIGGGVLLVLVLLVVGFLLFDNSGDEVEGATALSTQPPVPSAVLPSAPPVAETAAPTEEATQEQPPVATTAVEEPALVSVPNVTGSLVSDARETLARQGFSVNPVVLVQSGNPLPLDRVSDFAVVSTNPEPGSEVGENNKPSVTLIVESLGDDETTSSAPSTTASTDPTG